MTRAERTLSATAAVANVASAVPKQQLLLSGVHSG